jgi:DNA adenine methylase
MKPLISYYGGKQRIASRIVEVIDTIPHTVYCEPFFGGGAVFFARQRPSVSNNDHYREVINDSSKALINLYRVAREQPTEFERWIQFTPYSQEEHRRAIAICKEPENVTPLEWAWAYYVNINQSFAKKLSAGWGVGVSSENHSATWVNRKHDLPDCLDRLSSVHVSCEDALDVIKRWDSPHTLHYLDPPYPDTECGHYDGYTRDDLKRLCDLLDTIQGSYILSGYNCNIEPQSVQQRIEIDVTCSASGQGKVRNGDRSRKATQEELGDRKRTEVLWVCDRSAKARKELQGIMRVKQFSLLDL